MTETAAVAYHLGDRVEPSPFNVPWQKLMMWLFLCSDGMGFIGLMCAYAMLRAGSQGWPMLEWFEPGSYFHQHLTALIAANPGHVLSSFDVLGIPLTALNTFILICSSVTMVWAYKACVEKNVGALKRNLLLTIVGGLIFLGIQAYEWTSLIHEGLNVGGNPMGATFYAITGFHGAHVFSGVVYLFFVWLGVVRGKITTDHPVTVEVVGLFWHFVDLVWIVVFTVVYLIPSS